MAETKKRRNSVADSKVIEGFNKVRAAGGTNVDLAKELDMADTTLQVRLSTLRVSMLNATSTFKQGKGKPAINGQELADKLKIPVGKLQSESFITAHNKENGTAIKVPEVATVGFKLGSLSRISNERKDYSKMAELAKGLLDSVD